MTNKEAIAILTHNWKYHELIDNVYQYDALYLAINALKERPQGEWIPVSVQEPDVGGMYFVTAKMANGHICVDLARRISVDVWTFGGEELSGVEIIAWQPAPKPYKEAGDEQ